VGALDQLFPPGGADDDTVDPRFGSTHARDLAVEPEHASALLDSSATACHIIPGPSRGYSNSSMRVVIVVRGRTSMCRRAVFSDSP